jgi:hypothetical protein
MTNLTSPRLIKLKALLFLLIVLASSILLLLRTPEFTSALLLGVALWAACRAYYFAFYVMQHYVDPTFRYTGLWNMVRSPKRNPRES